MAPILILWLHSPNEAQDVSFEVSRSHTISDTHPVRLPSTRDQLVAEAAAHKRPKPEEKHPCSSKIRTRNPSNQAAELRFILQGHRYWLCAPLHSDKL